MTQLHENFSTTRGHEVYHQHYGKSGVHKLDMLPCGVISVTRHYTDRLVARVRGSVSEKRQEAMKKKALQLMRNTGASDIEDASIDDIALKLHGYRWAAQLNAKPFEHKLYNGGPSQCEVVPPPIPLDARVRTTYQQQPIAYQAAA
jgi:hypothetical protein